MGGGPDINFPEAPDTSGMEGVMMAQSEMAMAAAGAQLNFAKQQWAEQREMMQEVMDVQLPRCATRPSGPWKTASAGRPSLSLWKMSLYPG